MARRMTDRQRLNLLLASQEREVRQAFIAAFDRAASSIDRRAVLEALQAGNVARALDLLRIRDDLLAPLSEAIRSSYIAGGQMIGEAIPASRAVVGFDGRHPRAEQWVRDNAARRVTEVVADQREAIRLTVLGQVEQGRNPRQIITSIVGRVTPQGREGGVIGLTSQQARYVQNARAQLEALDAGYFERARRDRRFDSLVRKAIREDRPLAAADLDRITRRYEDRMLAYRAEVVSRTESVSALRAGRDEGIRQAIDSGDIRREQVKKRWIAARDERTRPDHAAMHGEEVPVDEPFVLPDGSEMMFPGDGSLGAPAEQLVMCRCTSAYVVNFLDG